LFFFSCPFFGPSKIQTLFFQQRPSNLSSSPWILHHQDAQNRLQGFFTLFLVFYFLNNSVMIQLPQEMKFW
jgi:hypothetical protein